MGFEQLETIELKANLTESQKTYLEKLMAELEKISGGKTAEQMDLKSLERFVKMTES